MLDQKWFRQDTHQLYEEWYFFLSDSARLAWMYFKAYIREGAASQKQAGIAPMLATRIAAHRWGISEEAITEMLSAAIKGGHLKVSDDHWVLVDRSAMVSPKTAERDEEKKIQPKEKQADKSGQTQTNADKSGQTRTKKETLSRDKTIQDHTSKKEPTNVGSKKETPADGSEPEVSEPLTDELALGPILRWFELGENLRASNLVKLIRGAPGYGDFEPSEEQFADFLNWIDAEAPDEDAVLGLVESFANAAAIHANQKTKSKPKYVDVIATLKDWARRAKAEWAQAKAAKARAKKEQMWLEDAEARAGKAPAPKMQSRPLEIEVPFAEPAERREVAPSAVDRILADVGTRKAAELPPKPRTASLEEQKRMLEAAG